MSGGFFLLLGGTDPGGDPWLGNGTVSVSRPSIQIDVYRSADVIPAVWHLVPSLLCCSAHWREGPDPGSATFRYKFDGLNADSPQNMEDALNSSFVVDDIVNPGDRLLVMATTPDGVAAPLFEGFALNFGPRLDSNTEEVFIGALGTAHRCWDDVIPGAMMQVDADSVVSLPIQTDVFAHFNPKGEPNATVEGLDADVGTFETPIFVDPIPNDPDRRRIWDLSMASRYLVYVGNTNETYVQNPDDDAFDKLISKDAIDDISFDPNDPATYTSGPIIIADKPITGKDWPSCLHDLLRHNAYQMAWRMTVGALTGIIRTKLDIYGEQSRPAKDVLLQARGELLNPALSNLGEADFSRNCDSLVNEWQVDGGLVRYEASFVLAPAFPMAAADAATPAAIRAYNKSSEPAFSTTNHDKYRLYVFDEAGDGHYDVGDDTIDSTPGDLSPMFGDAVDGVPPFTDRHRKPIGTLNTLDDAGRPLKYKLAISTDYAGTKPGLWDGVGGTWQTVTGGFEVLKDRIGIYINVADPNHWLIGKSKVVGHPFKPGIVKGVSDQATVGAKNFHLRLTCVIESDTNLKAIAGRSGASPLPNTIARRVDARDRYFKTIVSKASEFYSLDAQAVVSGDTTLDYKIIRNDFDNALAEAHARVFASQSGVLSGDLMVPRFTMYYALGDRIRQIKGRNLSFRTDGGGNDNAPVYPTVVGIRWELEHGQNTFLSISDTQRSKRMTQPRIYPKGHRRVNGHNIWHEGMKPITIANDDHPDDHDFF